MAVDGFRRLEFLCKKLLPFSLQFFTRLSAVFAEKVGGFDLLLSFNWKCLERHWWS